MSVNNLLSTLNLPGHSERKFALFYLLKGPAADATDAPQPWRFYCVTLWGRWRRWWGFFCFSILMEHRWNDIDRGNPNGAPVEWHWQGKPDVLGEKPVPVPLCPPQIPHGPTPGSNPSLRSERPVTNRLSHGTAQVRSLLRRQILCRACNRRNIMQVFSRQIHI
jgi:hypothetical protein